MKKMMFGGLAALALLGACSTSKDGGGTTAPPETTAPTSTESTVPGSAVETTDSSVPSESTITPIVDDRAPGVSADTIKVGVALLDLSTLKDVIGIDHGDYQGAFQAVFDLINSQGGINGRKLEPVYAQVNPAGADSDTAACTKMTQDDPVFVAVGFFLNDSALCFVQDNATPMIGGDLTAERLGKATVPWFSTQPSESQSIHAMVALAKAGKLSGKLGVVGEGGDKTAWETQFKPALEAAGVTPIDVAFIDSTVGDANAINAAGQTVAAKLESEGVDQVMMLGNVGGYFPRAIAGGSYTPSLVFTTLNAAATYSGAAGNDLSVLEGALTADKFDTGNEFESLTDPLTTECLDAQRAAGFTLVPGRDVPSGQPTQITSSMTACTTMYLLKAILEKAGPELNFGTYATAAYNLGAVELPGYPDPWHFTKATPDGDPQLYPYLWDASKEWVVEKK